MKTLRLVLVSLILPLLFLFFWHGMSLHVDNPRILPSIPTVWGLLTNPTQNLIGVGSLLNNTGISLLRVFVGYILAAVVAIPLGVVIGYSKSANRLLLPFLSLFRSVPPMAWVPLVLAWFGITSLATVLNIPPGPGAFVVLNNLRLSMAFIIFLGAFFPILSNTVHGIKEVRETLVKAARSMGATDWQIVRKVHLPHAAPSIFTGLQVGLGTAWMCLVCAEMLPGSIAGLGYLISHAYQVTRLDVVIAGMVTISLVGFLLDFGFLMLGKRLFKWQTRGE